MASDICKVLNIILLVIQLEKQNMDIFYFYFNIQGVLNNKTDKSFPNFNECRDKQYGFYRRGQSFQSEGQSKSPDI